MSNLALSFCLFQCNVSAHYYSINSCVSKCSAIRIKLIINIDHGCNLIVNHIFTICHLSINNTRGADSQSEGPKQYFHHNETVVSLAFIQSVTIKLIENSSVYKNLMISFS